jgi:hypothetical protein
MSVPFYVVQDENNPPDRIGNARNREEGAVEAPLEGPRPCDLGPDSGKAGHSSELTDQRTRWTVPMIAKQPIKMVKAGRKIADNITWAPC